MEAIAGSLEREGRFNPFPGLRPFEPDEDHLFFGRERETDELLRRLRTNRFVSVLGTSGSGKSSLVRSGLIPSLHSGFMVAAGSDWRVGLLRPGEDPIGNLAAALDHPDVLGDGGELGEAGRMLLESTLRRSDLGLADCARHARRPGNLLVVVDQFEELFRFRESRREHGSRDEAVAFAKLLLGAASQEKAPVYVVITMRSDFIGDCMEYPGLPEAINQGQYLIPRMTREELRQAITGPVAVGGGTIAPRLVTRLLNEVGDDPDQLPVLQHALMRTWDRWDASGPSGNPLDLAEYEAIGTMSEGLSRHAEEAYEELGDDRRRKIAERLFKALTDKASDGRGVRRPTAVSEVAALAECPESEVVEVVEAFRVPGRSFLMPPSGVALDGDSILDLSHESLMRNWSRLADWVEEETVSGKSYRRLSRAAGRHQRGEGSLWVDPELALGLQWRAETEPTAAWALRYDRRFERAMGFLEQSREAQDAARRAEEEARRAKLRRARIVTAVLGASAVVTLVFGALAVQAGAEARRAQQAAALQAETAGAVSTFLEELFEVADPEEARGDSVTAQEILDEGARKVRTELAGQPAVQARMMGTIGEVYGSLGLYEDEEPLAESAVETARAALGAEHPETLAALHHLAESRLNRGRAAGAVELYREAADGRAARLGENNPDTLDSLHGLAEAHLAQSDYADAEAAARRALDGRARVLGEDHREALKSAHLLGGVLQAAGRFREAEPQLQETLEAQRRTLGDGHPDTVATMGNLGGLYAELGRYDEAEELYRRNLERTREVFGDEHPKTFSAMRRLAMLDQDRGHNEMAAGKLEEILAGRRRVLGEEHVSTLNAQDDLAWTYGLIGRNDEATALARRTFEAGVRTLGEEHATTRAFANTLGATLIWQGQFPEAERLWVENLEIDIRRYGEMNPNTFTSRNNLASLYGSWGRIDRQEALFRENLEKATEFYGADHPQAMFYTTNLVAILNGQRRYDEAEELGAENLERHRRIFGDEHPQTFRANIRVAFTYLGLGRLEEVEKLGLEVVEGQESFYGEDHPETLGTLSGLASFYENTDRHQEALPLRERVLAGRRRAFGDEHPSIIGALTGLASLYQTTGQGEKALELRREAMELRRRLAVADDAGPEDVHRYASARTYARPELQDPEEALRFALRAAEMTGRENRNYLGTLANAYFLNGRVDEAIATQEEAITLLTEDDVGARTGFENRLAEFRRASGDESARREAQIAELERERQAAEAPGASPRARNAYAWELVTADPEDLRDPARAVEVSLAVNQETGFRDPQLLRTLAVAYHAAGRREEALETQRRVIELTPENDVRAVYENEVKLAIFSGRGTREADLAATVPGTWATQVGPVRVEVEFRRRGDHLVGVNRIELPFGVPAGVDWFRFDLETGELENAAADAGWTNVRWRPERYLFLEGDLITWGLGWNAVRLEKE